MSIDVEGGELEVLQGMDWNIPVRVILMECLVAECESMNRRTEAAKEILRENGFVFHKQVGDNEVWHNPSYSRYSQHLDIQHDDWL